MVILDYRDARPIYGQIKDSLRRLIVAGALGPDEKLPSIRALALFGSLVEELEQLLA